MEKEKYHFIAIGGIGMSGLAKYLLEQGCEVSGSDIEDSKYMQKLKKLGANVYVGHSESNLPDDCIVVASTAIKEDNPELQKAKKLNLPIYHRSDILEKLSKSSNCFIGYSGTHGKTTTSGMSAYVLEKADLKPSFVVGGIIPDVATNAKYETDNYFVAELDESDGTIVKYSPHISVINNLEEDHIDFYKDGMNSLVSTFDVYLGGLRDNSKVLINNDCKGNLLLRGHDFITFGMNDADYVAKNIEMTLSGSTFDIYHKGELLINLKIKLMGKHNIMNTLAVASSLNEAGIDLKLLKEHFATFTGMGRRFQLVGEINGAVLYDDYAHHPTEIKAAISSFKEFKNKNVIAVFQPHRYTRLKSLWNEFLGAFEGCSKVYVTDIYAASEKPIEGVEASVFAKELNEKIPCEHISGTIKEVAKNILLSLKKDDVVIGLGAGTITNLGYDMIELNKEILQIGH